jgi:hypothetical protein
MNAPYTLDQLHAIIARVRALAAQYPEAVYVKPTGRPVGEVDAEDEEANEFCSYFEGTVRGTDLTGCLFGQPLREMGLLTEDVDRSIHGLATGGDDRTPADEIRTPLAWCSLAQRQQDSGKTWGDAVRCADRMFPGVI